MTIDLNQPIKGKTYSLFGDHDTTSYFYDRISSLTDRILDNDGLSEKVLLNNIQKISLNRRNLKRAALQGGPDPKLSALLALLHESLNEFSTDVEEHLRATPVYKFITDRGLLTTREQYYLYMLEFELVNRIHLEDFRKANYRIALLPYCLRETQTQCKAESDLVDYQCTGCRKECYINQVSELLRDNKIDPYIWRRAKLKSLFRDLVVKHGTIGVLGIACIVELSAGMRRCMKAKLPVVGIPLNANRCSRWMDQFQDTSVDLKALERLMIG